MNVARSKADRIIEGCESRDIAVVGVPDGAFPQRLAGSTGTAILYIRGRITDQWSHNGVALVGTRKPTEAGISATKNVSAQFAAAGWTIVSGLALGVDSIAYRQALAHAATTIAIVGNGLDSVYPAVNRDLADEILATGGLIVSEQPPGAEASPRNLVARDRLQSGLADLTVVTQSSISGGAMHTARFAFEQGRRIYCPMIDPPQLEDEGTRALLSRSPEELRMTVRAWGRISDKSVDARGSAPTASVLEQETIEGILRDGMASAAVKGTDGGQRH